MEHMYLLISDYQCAQVKWSGDFKSDIWKDGNNVISLRLSSTHVFETAHIYAPACRDAREGNNHRFLTAWQHGYGCEGISSATMWSGLKAVSYLLNRTVCCQSNTVSTQLHIQPFLSFLFFLNRHYFYCSRTRGHSQSKSIFSKLLVPHGSLPAVHLG